MDSSGVTMILFRDGGLGLGDAAWLLRDRGLDVTLEAEALAVRWDQGEGPVLTVSLHSGEAIRQETVGIGEGTPHAAALGGCDSRFEVAFDDLGEVLDDINTLIEVQLTLQQATGGFLFNTWNCELSPPPE
jgi:hypothetical protein